MCLYDYVIFPIDSMHQTSKDLVAHLTVLIPLTNQDLMLQTKDSVNNDLHLEDLVVQGVQDQTKMKDLVDVVDQAQGVLDQINMIDLVGQVQEVQDQIRMKDLEVVVDLVHEVKGQNKIKISRKEIGFVKHVEKIILLEEQIVLDADFQKELKRMTHNKIIIDSNLHLEEDLVVQGHKDQIKMKDLVDVVDNNSNKTVTIKINNH